MCPVCIASTAVMIAGAGSTGGVLAVCIVKFKSVFKSSRSFSARRNTIAKSKETEERRKGQVDMNTPPIVWQQASRGHQQSRIGAE
jgi:hypothetical protein